MLCFVYNSTTTDENNECYVHEESKGLTMKNEIILYRPDEIAEHIEVRFEDDTAWLTQAQVAELFGTNSQAITKHIKNIYSTGELDKISTCSILEQVQHEGIRKVKRRISHYNLDVIISVGYRVNSINATLFRRWATEKLRDYLLNGFLVNTRMDCIEDNADVLKHRVDEIELQLKTENVQKQGIFCDGQIFDAYVFVSDLVRQAGKSIVLIDNYIDERILLILSKRQVNVTAIIYTQKVTPQIQLDLTKHNAQYDPITINTTTKFHDRFLIIDDTVYHIGASLKDLGKKLFAFSKMEIEPTNLLKNI